ncbi:MAG: alpha-L-arabinofuranosidase C-terminal domain-containing protein [Armatimonadia bacterium]
MTCRNAVSFLICLAAVFFPTSSPLFAAGHDATIVVHPDRVTGRVNPLIFGNNQLAYQERPEYSNQGAGIWDPVRHAPVPEYVELSKQAGITIQRWPGGCTAHNYNWKKTVGPLAERPQMLFGLPEFMRYCEDTGAQALITLSVYWGSEADAADIVEYLNLPVGKNPNGGPDWAAVRAADGHPQPYNVIYFEYGNEDYHGEHKTKDNPNPRKITPEDYARQYLAYQQAMKALDPRIRLGGLLQYGLWDWNKAVLQGCGKQMDFGIEHTYTPGFQGDTDETRGRLYMRACAASDLHIQRIYDKLHAQIKEVCGRDDMQLAITEYNGWFVQEKPVPYRQAFANALRNAEHLRVMMRPENRILMGNFWEFANEYWGMVKGFVDRGQTPVRQANYFPYQMYHEHFGDTLVACDVQCGTWDFPGGPLPARQGTPSTFKLFDENLLPKDYVWEPRQPEQGATQKIEGQVVAVEFSGNDVNYYSARTTLPAEGGMGYRVTGSIKTEGITDAHGLGFQVGDARGWTETKSCQLGGSVSGTKDWQKVEIEYTTLPDATQIEILARRLGGTGNISGKGWWRLDSVQKFRPENSGAVPDLGVNTARRADGTITLMIVNKNFDEAVPVRIEVEKGKPQAGKARAWLLTGPSPEANNLKQPDNIKLTEEPVAVRDGAYWLTLPGCSMAAVEIAP